MSYENPLFLIFCVVVGLPALAYWAWSVLTDGPHPPNEDPEDIINSIPPPRTPDIPGSDAGGFNPKNFTALFAPSLGILLLSIPISELLDTLLDPESILLGSINLVLLFSSLIGLLGVIIGMTSVTLPRWMYPEWQRARRTIRRREKARQQAAGHHDPATSSYDTPGSSRDSSRKKTRVKARDAIPWPPPAWTSTRH